VPLAPSDLANHHMIQHFSSIDISNIIFIPRKHVTLLLYCALNGCYLLWLVSKLVAMCSLVTQFHYKHVCKLACMNTKHIGMISIYAYYRTNSADELVYSHEGMKVKSMHV